MSHQPTADEGPRRPTTRGPEPPIKVGGFERSFVVHMLRDFFIVLVSVHEEKMRAIGEFGQTLLQRIHRTPRDASATP